VKVYLRTFGCRANHYDTEAVRELAESGGHTVVTSLADADIAVFNGCAVTTDAEAELRKSVRRAARERPQVRSIVMGCAAALDGRNTGDRELASLPTVDAVIGGADLDAIARALDVVPIKPRRTRAQTGTRALLRIQDGCDEHCTFCATTLARGANRSRPIDELVDEASVLAERHSEIVITGIHIGGYGADLGSSLSRLLERLVRDVPTARFRLSSIEATEVDARLSELLVGAPRHLAPHLHAPLQSGSDRLLKRMGRHWYTASSYASAIERLASRMPALGLGADVITGFPGETDADHRATMTLVEQLPFTYLHVFPFSARPGTAALRLPDPVAPAVADRRASALRALADRKTAECLSARDGTMADVIAIGPVGPHRVGLTSDYLDVRLAGSSAPRGARFDAKLALVDGQLSADEQ
jgi:threonylcarbamoyladenosine tRNA methylthiotransferase MtaB